MKLHLPTLNQFAYLLVLNITNAVFQLLIILTLVQFAQPINIGKYFVALSFSVLLSIFVNFGTAQTAPVALKKAENIIEQHILFAEAIAIRIVPFLLSTFICFSSYYISPNYGKLILLTIPAILAELINPQVFLIARYNVKWYTLLNILLKLIAFSVLYFSKAHAHIIELSIIVSGASTLLLNFFFLDIKVLTKLPSASTIIRSTKSNLLVMANGMMGQLQQSLFLIALPNFASAIFISAYGFVDKILASFKMMVNAYGTAFIPRAADLHKVGYENWKKNKKQQNLILGISCSVIAIIMFFFPQDLLSIFLLGKQKESLFFIETANLIKINAFVPLLISLNLLNVAEVFLEKKYTLYFNAGLILLSITLICLGVLKLGLPYNFAGYYPMIIEGASLVIFLFILKNIRNAQH